MEKKNENNNMKKNEKKKFVQNLGWATAQLYCKRKRNCIAIQSLYCSGAPRMGWECIAIHWLVLQR